MKDINDCVLTRLWFTYRKNFLPIGIQNYLFCKFDFAQLFSIVVIIVYNTLFRCFRRDRSSVRFRLGLYATMWTDDAWPGIYT